MNLVRWLRNSQNGNNRRGAAHMTWAKTSVGRSISRTGLFLKRQIWIWPIIAVVLLSLIGLFVRQAIETTMRNGLKSQLQTVVDLEAAMLKSWYQVQRSNAESLANNVDIRQTVYPLLETSDDESGTAADATETLRAKLDKSIGPAITAHRYAGYWVADKNKRIVASGRRELIGQQNLPEYDSFLTAALDGSTNVSAPFSSMVLMQDDTGRLRTGKPTMFVAAPIRDDSFQVVGVLALRLDPDQEFSRILSLGRFGETGETYAFDKEGRMVSESRFNDSLILLGLLPDQEDSKSILQLLVRDPGGDITAGYNPTARRRDLPPTFAVQEALAGRAGVSVDGYRDYRGVPVVGAWKWLPEGKIGMVTEVDYAEAFYPLTILRRTFWGLFALLAASAAAIFVFSILLARSRREAQKAAIEAQQIGQYKLEQKIGSGGMGVVYKAQHAMLRRPTAIKMLDVDKVNEASMQRFEREVQITSQLNNPHTVAIYDYGRTPEGLFYYAMEYLDGIDLQSLVERYGPQPTPRVIHILQQVCSSLYEAHSLGLVHRDIKPANIMLNRRGGEPDVVKVLDFGLVKALDEEKRAGGTQQGSLTGTPLYMSPEAIEMPNSVDARSDLYALGAVGYFMLTGGPVFDAENVMDLCKKHIATPPVPPSERSRTAIPPELESALMACLEKSRAKRPQTARDLSLLLSRSSEAAGWSIEEADAWWGIHERGQASAIRRVTVPARSTAADSRDVTIDLPGSRG
ncbi:MAG TPA: serine/threonine protein kinase [Lacipirellulaceae bacterium]|nr:serine/threonine protein kinase [Lacipirellulaceae bacterium]